MQLRLRWRILLFTMLPLVAFAFITLWVVNRSISQQVHDGIERDLKRASAVLDNMVEAREQALAAAARVIVADPKFISVLSIPGAHDDPQLRATVGGVALDFNRITQADLFEVLNANGRLLASVGRDASSRRGRADLAASALEGRAASGVVVEPHAHFLATAVPVVAGREVAGVLLLGSRIDPSLAEDLRDLTRSEVTFISGAEITGTTLDHSEEHRALLKAFAVPPAITRADGTVSELLANGHTYLTLARPLGESSGERSQIVVIQRALDQETAFLNTMQSDLAELGIAAVLIALLAGYLSVKRITSPVRRLVRGAEEMERGNFDYRLDVPDGDEIGYLARRFEFMRERHRTYVHSLQEVARVKGEFLAVASHELRTPISVISGFRELMANGRLGPVTPRQKQGLEAMERSIEKLTRITEDATRMAQIHEDRLVLDRASIDGTQLVEQAVADAVSDAPDRFVRIECDVHGLGAIRVDGERLRTAIANVVRNGIRFTPDGGRVRIEARRDTGHLEITVTDTGIGIPPDRLATLFDAAYGGHSSLNHHSSSRLEFNSAGLGLGLSIARGIVQAHRGTLLVSSQQGRGSTFVIRIPEGNRRADPVEGQKAA